MIDFNPFHPLGYGKCGVAVIRISGPEALIALQRMTKISTLKPRKAILQKIHDPKTKEFLDKGLCLWFPEPNSFTGEDSVEFHVHGGPAVITSILDALSKLHFQPALPGEFTKRAFLNGKVDLTEAEGIGDLIDAETEKQRKQAFNQAGGSLRRLYDSWRTILLNSLASLEAYIDFSEEHGLGSHVLEDTKITLHKLCGKLEQHLADGRKGEILRTGVRVAILGEPNVGKSSLLNLLSRRNAAIVTSTPGTTRDVIELTTNICGYPMILADTAGIRKDPENEIEVEGIRRAKECTKRADIVICIISAEKKFACSFQEFMENYKNCLEIQLDNVLIVLNKIDLLEEIERQRWKVFNVVAISCKTEEGLQQLINALTEYFQKICGDPAEESPVISRARYRNHLTHVVEYIKAYLRKTEIQNYDMAISLQDIRCAARELGKITGSINNEEVLDIIFKNFCIGK
ncbi:PREDICTED: tRNA modification GTPase GTPBP3, mitochondrial [Dufourea novaeangliae]|uniref:tRNA modification GTPase GTPBP3, mitochondrial n=1 Tax=Dufourea novaeangliae TaxID=178035 RepID=A0A154PHD3_DUFNO|nr:PREDICTED: tRNA modification GTPase GTPBP3, mitochondrial [Dufourea novaeangliae]KZC11271.1 tRNA modification GTPase GTPBP3, mitochondrial [Dufourea novaeangliae]